MTTDQSVVRGPDDDVPPDDFTAFLSLLNELKATGCSLLVVGDAPRELFTRASSNLLGDAESIRHRVVAATDATSDSIAERLPNPDETPRPLSETARILNHAGAPRSVAAEATDVSGDLGGIRETRIADPELQGLQAGLVDAIGDVATEASDLRPADLRVGVDSLGPLVDHYGEDAVRRCLRRVGGHVRHYNGMAHYVLAEEYDSEVVESFLPDVDAVIELRAVDPVEHDHDAQQRWHVPDRELVTEWTPL
ncbi:DUF7504 family protein [Halorussus lipolyticus]|uniref:DUF7504 family protein n=1 Tax=Halorussus lipolyticus TaxID=3034024 RepID=UPI0023E758C3|nr:hypothetical protein [Halorussus sp. DT80]